jgi:Na+/H+ antiporter NhaA
MEPLGPMEDWLYHPSTAEALRPKPEPLEPRERPLLAMLAGIGFLITIFVVAVALVAVIKSFANNNVVGILSGFIVATIGVKVIWVARSISRRLRNRV